MSSDPTRSDRALESEDDEEIVEIDEDGNIYPAHEAPRGGGRKPTILRDPRGEY